MSLAEISLGAAVKRQFLFKLKADIDVYSFLTIMQLFAFAILRRQNQIRGAR